MSSNESNIWSDVTNSVDDEYKYYWQKERLRIDLIITTGHSEMNLKEPAQNYQNMSG